jgi:perosamine synthetase
MFIKHSSPSINHLELRSLSNVLRSKYITQGKIVHKFEKNIIKYLNNKKVKAVAVNSGSSALHLTLLSLGISAKDEIIIPSYVCSAILNIINYIGAKPVLTDINDYDFGINFQATKKKITKHTRAIIIPHLFGFPVKIDKFSALGIPIIEDCAQSIGARYKNKSVGTFGKLSVFSFYATKMLTTGYGGMVISKDIKLINRIRNLIDYDNRNDYITRYNYQMSDLEASLGLAQVKKLNGFIQRRRQIASQYTSFLESLNLSDLVLPKEYPNTTSVFYRYVIRHPKAAKIIISMNRNGIEAKKPVYKPLHHYLGFNTKEFPNTENAYRTAISLPIYPSLTNQEIGCIMREQLFKIK